MSFRSRFMQAEEAGQAVLKETELASIGDKMKQFCDDLSGRLDLLCEKARTGEMNRQKFLQACKDIRLVYNCEHLTPSDVTKEKIEALPGYQKFHSLCKSDYMDIQCAVVVKNGLEPAFIGASRGCTIPLAAFDISVRPDLLYINNPNPFDDSRLVIIEKGKSMQTYPVTEYPVPAYRASLEVAEQFLKTRMADRLVFRP